MLFVLATVAVWTFLGVCLGLQAYLNSFGADRPVRLIDALQRSVGRYLIYVPLTVALYWICERFPFTKGRRLTSLAAHLVSLCGFILFYTTTWLLLLAPASALQQGMLQAGARVTRANLFEQFWMYSSIAGVLFAFQYYRQYRKRELQEAELRRQVAEYELHILKLQLHPHFLFNTLNSISTLMTSDVATARQMLVRLSDLLRLALSHSSSREISLKEELDFVDAYLELQRIRFGDRLQVVMEIAPEALDAKVPNMILQPLVENAVRHGISELRSGGVVGVHAQRSNGTLHISVVNDGPQSSRNGSRSKGTGLGLTNTRSRLLQLYGDTYRLQLNPRAAGGMEVELAIPFEEVEHEPV